MRELRGDWRDLFNNFSVALDPRKMFLALVGMLMSFALLNVWFWLWNKGLSLGLFVGTVPVSLNNLPKIFGMIPAILITKYPNAYYLALIYISMFYTGTIMLLVLVWSFFGGAITRIAAVEIAKDERIELSSAMHYGTKKYSNFFWSKLTCAVIFLVFFLCIGIACLLARIPVAGPFLKIILVIFLPLALLTSFLMALIAIGATFGHVLFYPAISSEGTDAFDAISRGFSYLFAEPWRYIWYQIVSGVYGFVTFMFVLFFGNLVICITLFAARLGMGQHSFSYMVKNIYPMFTHFLDGMKYIPTNPGPVETVSTIIFTAWIVIFMLFIISFAVSYFFSGQTMIYFLLRKKVDSIDMTEVYEEKESEEELKEETPPAPAEQPKP